MITLHIIDIHFEPNNTFPHIWILHVALFDHIGSPLVSLLSFRYHQVRSPSVFSSSRINILCGVNTHSDRTRRVSTGEGKAEVLSCRGGLFVSLAVSTITGENRM